MALFRPRNKIGIFPLAGAPAAGYHSEWFDSTSQHCKIEPYSEDNTMERPGEKLRQARERLGLTYRDVVEASQKIAERRASEEFSLALSRLADIENKGTLPTIYRLYTLCAIYRLDWREVLRWYGVPLDLLAVDALQIRHAGTHAIHFAVEGTAAVPPGLDREIDLNKTTFLQHTVGRWGKMPLSFLAGLEQRHLHYGLVGMSDWSMYPILQPGSLVLIDQNRRKIMVDGPANTTGLSIF
jgi:transcriptional regulator with XRE-family HTH domain